MSLVLIVEDNSMNLELTRDILQSRGHATLESDNAEEGLRLAATNRPDLILMDIQLPGMSGIEALKALRADSGTAGIPVIAVTASVMRSDREAIMRAGFDGFIEKPITVRTFIETVERVLEQSRR
jgi:two-component system cell cycle response regulator DivK